MKVALLAPLASSLYSRQVLHGLLVEPSISVCAVIVRSLVSIKRFRSEFRRDGVRLLRKIRDKLVLPGDRSGNTSEPPDLKELCRDQKVAYLVVPDHNHPRAQRLLRDHLPDLILFTGGGLIRRNILELPAIGVLNCHSGILPAYRGMDVVEWALLEGLSNHVGLTLHLMDTGVDTGPVLFRRHVPPGYQETLPDLRKRMEKMMPRLMLEAVRGLRDNKFLPQLQSPEQGKQYFVMHPRLKTRIKP